MSPKWILESQAGDPQTLLSIPAAEVDDADSLSRNPFVMNFWERFYISLQFISSHSVPGKTMGAISIANELISQENKPQRGKRQL